MIANCDPYDLGDAVGFDHRRAAPTFDRIRLRRLNTAAIAHTTMYGGLAETTTYRDAYDAFDSYDFYAPMPTVYVPPPKRAALTWVYTADPESLRRLPDAARADGGWDSGAFSHLAGLPPYDAPGRSLEDLGGALAATVILAKVGARVAGGVAVVIYGDAAAERRPPQHPDRQAWIEFVYRPTAAVGTELVARAVAWLRERAGLLRRRNVYVSPVASAAPFWRRCGFARVADSHARHRVEVEVRWDDNDDDDDPSYDPVTITFGADGGVAGYTSRMGKTYDDGYLADFSDRGALMCAPLGLADPAALEGETLAPDDGGKNGVGAPYACEAS